MIISPLFSNFQLERTKTVRLKLDKPVFLGYTTNITTKHGEQMDTHGMEMPQVGDLYVSETQGRLHILVSYEFEYYCRVTFYRYYKSKLKRMDDGTITCWTRPQHEFYKRYKPLKAESK